MKTNVRFSVAPMMAWTDRHYRYLARLIHPNIWLYTEMVHAGAVVHGDPERHLAKSIEETPISLQLGGSDPKLCAQAAQVATRWNYDEINLNCGCPSSRVQKGAFGACLMRASDRVSDCVIAMAALSNCPITIKTRIGLDNEDSFDFLANFIDRVSQRAPVERWIIHARKALLKGLSPKENRSKPPLNYDRVVAIQAAFQNLKIELNGGLSCDLGLMERFPTLAGFMIGREAYQRPYALASLLKKPGSQHTIVKQYQTYVAHALSQGVRLQTLIKPLLGLFHGVNGANQWHRHLSKSAQTCNSSQMIDAALLKIKSG